MLVVEGRGKLETPRRLGRAKEGVATDVIGLDPCMPTSGAHGCKGTPWTVSFVDPPKAGSPWWKVFCPTR